MGFLSLADLPGLSSLDFNSKLNVVIGFVSLRSLHVPERSNENFSPSNFGNLQTPLAEC